MQRVRRSSRKLRDTVAAGGVVLRRGPDGAEVVLAGRRSDGSWVFPKGTPDVGESLEETAAREVREETGLEVRIVRPLGVTEYWFATSRERIHKTVHFFLMEAVGGDLSLHDREYDDIRWVGADEARRLLSFDTYRDILDRALAAERAA